MSIRKAIDLEPANPASCLTLGVILARLGRREDALVAYGEAIEHARNRARDRRGRPLDSLAGGAARPSSPAELRAQAHCQRAGILLALGRHRDALDDAEAAIRLDRTHALAHATRAQALQKLGEVDNARRAMAEAVALDPQDDRVLEFQAVFLWRDGSREDAVKALTKAIELTPWRTTLWTLRGADASRWSSLPGSPGRCGRTEQAARFPLPASRTTPYFHDLRGKALTGLGQSEDALRELDAAVDLGLEAVTTHLARATCLAELDRYEDALEACDAVEKLGWSGASIHQAIGFFFFLCSLSFGSVLLVSNQRGPRPHCADQTCRFILRFDRAGADRSALDAPFSPGRSSQTSMHPIDSTLDLTMARQQDESCFSLPCTRHTKISQ